MIGIIAGLTNAALSIGTTLIFEHLGHAAKGPEFGETMSLLGIRFSIAVALQRIVVGIEWAVVTIVLLVLLLMILRKRTLAAAAFFAVSLTGGPPAFARPARSTATAPPTAVCTTGPAP